MNRTKKLAPVAGVALGMGFIAIENGFEAGCA